MEVLMVPWELLDRVSIPGGKSELRLYRRGEEFSIKLERDDLMTSRMHNSEDALAELACAKLGKRSRRPGPDRRAGNGIYGGGGIKQVGADGQVVVAELVPAVVKWNRGPLADLAGRPLEDKRVSVCEGDVAQILKVERGTYDAILLDVDNGPEGLTREGNNWLYSPAGLAAISRTLRPGGVLAVWSLSPDRAFTRRLSESGFEVEEVQVRSRSARKGSRHTIWIGQRG